MPMASTLDFIKNTIIHDILSALKDPMTASLLELMTYTEMAALKQITKILLNKMTEKTKQQEIHQSNNDT